MERSAVSCSISGVVQFFDNLFVAVAFGNALKDQANGRGFVFVDLITLVDDFQSVGSATAGGFALLGVIAFSRHVSTCGDSGRILTEDDHKPAREFSCGRSRIGDVISGDNVAMIHFEILEGQKRVCRVSIQTVKTHTNDGVELLLLDRLLKREELGSLVGEHSAYVVFGIDLYKLHIRVRRDKILADRDLRLKGGFAHVLLALASVDCDAEIVQSAFSF